MCQLVSINYHVCNPQGKHFCFYLERVSDLLYGLLLSSAPDKTLTREALNTAQQLLPRFLSSCRQHLSMYKTRMLPAVAPASPQSWSVLLGLKAPGCWGFPPARSVEVRVLRIVYWLAAGSSICRNLPGEGHQVMQVIDISRMNQAGTHRSSWLCSKCWVSGWWGRFVLWFGIIISRTIPRSVWNLRLLPR